MIMAMKYLPENFYYVIVGDGDLKNKLNEVVENNNLVNRVRLLGYRRDISAICNSSDIYVMPSFQEGISVALMEGMACGLPVVASRIRGNVDLIDDQKGGILVETIDSEAYADAVKQIFENDLCSKFGEYNREKVMKFDIETVRKQIKTVFEEI
jgi:glycosyltransferase involved in cell wall biosynthesis